MALDIRDAGEERHLPVPAAPEIPSRNPIIRLHPAIYEIIAALAVLFVIGAWGFFAPNDTYYLLEVVTGFVFVAVFLPFQLWRVRRHGHDPRDISLSHRSFRSWLSAEVDVWQGHMKGRDAAAGILLPVTAVAVAMICFAIIINIEIG